MQESRGGLPPAIHLHAAGLRYGGQEIFSALDLTIAAGLTTCLLGPSGVGKTSLLRLIAGLAHGAEGEAVDDHGRSLQGRVAYLAQSDLLLPWLSVVDNVTLGYRLRGRPADGAMRDRARTLLARVGLAPNEGDRPAALSGGMRQRVALARTLMEDRSVVLMDEPFSALDAITRFELQALTSELLADRTVLLVTHDPMEALRVGHRIHVMVGRPASLDRALTPEGAPPRPIDAPSVLSHQSELLRRLTEAKRGRAVEAPNAGKAGPAPP